MKPATKKKSSFLLDIYSEKETAKEYMLRPIGHPTGLMEATAKAIKGI